MRRQHGGRQGISAGHARGQQLFARAMAAVRRAWQGVLGEAGRPTPIDVLEPRIVLSSGLAITEFMAVNGGTLADENGEYADWIEIGNTSAVAVNLEGWSLTDDPNRPAKWRFPSVSINPGSYLVVFASGKNRIADPARLHTNFSLKSEGEYLALVRPDGMTVESSYTDVPQQQMDVSYGVDSASGGKLRHFATPTPGQANARAEVVINEIHYNPDVDTELVEFIELHNPGAAAVNLSGARFNAGIDYTFPDGTMLQPGAYLVVTQDPAHFQAKFSKTAMGPWVGKLSNEGETVRIVNRTGGVLDEVTYKMGFPWPIVGGAPGYSIELINPDFDNSVGGNWRSAAPAVPGQQQTLISSGSSWWYRKGTSEASSPTTLWRQLNFTMDGTWQQGNAPVGYDPSVPMGTFLGDMRNNYTSFFMRKTFTVNDPSQVSALQLQAMYDDGFNVWINGYHVARANMPANEVAFNATSSANARESATYDPFNLPNPAAYLVAGTNVITVQLHNVNISNSSDAYFDARLIATVGGTSGQSPSPGARNASHAVNAAPQMHEVVHSPKQPTAGQEVRITAHVTDPDGVATVLLRYQIVNPGAYISFTDAAYQTSWVSVAMRDDGQGGDAVAGDGIYTFVMPGSLQQHRRLIRYRISVTDFLGASITAPYADDGAQNFVYFCYNGVPAWTGSMMPGVSTPITFGTDVMNSLPVYHLLSKKSDVEQATWDEKYGGDLYKWQGTLVYDGEVYDGVTYRMRGGVWRYAMGKNMWKFSFPRGHDFQAHDDYGNPYDTTWRKLNLGAAIQQGDYWHRGEQGLFESVGFKLFNLAGVPAPNTSFIQFRIVDDASENGTNQYNGDLWGLYLAIEQMDGRFLEEHDLPDGNLYKMESGSGPGGGDLNNQGPTQPTDNSDLVAFTSTYSSTTPSDQWWRDNLDLAHYYSYRAIVEAIHHGDIGYGKNYYYFNNPETGKWQVLPWDLDLTWADNMYGNGAEPFRDRVLPRPAFNVEYKNRLREIRDLLFNPEQTGMLIDEMAARIYTPGQLSFVNVDRFMWDFNPVMNDSSRVNLSKAGQGRFYVGGGGQVIPPPGGFPGMIQKMKNYVVWRGSTATSGWTPMDTLAADSQIPQKPSITRLGEATYPLNDLRFRASPFTDATGVFSKVQWRIAEVTDPNAPGFDPKAPRKYEIESAWESESGFYDRDIAIPPVVERDGRPVTVVTAGQLYRVRVRYMDSTGRWSNWSDPHQFVAASATSAPVDSLRITELHYRPANPPGSSPISDRDAFEFIELKNIGAAPLDLKDVKFDIGIAFTFPESVLAPGEVGVIVRQLDAFTSRYPTTGMRIFGEYSGGLSNSGERLRLLDAYGQTILDFSYDVTEPWADAHGSGRSLVFTNPALPASAWTDPANWRLSRSVHGTPGADEITLADGAIVVNELSSAPEASPPGDWVELYNTTDQDIDIGGWWLSDRTDRPDRYRIPSGTIVPARGYFVLTEAGHFGNPALPADQRFGLDRLGEAVVISSATSAGVLNGYVHALSFDASERGMSLGRVVNSVGQDFLLPLVEPTPGYANAAPIIGPIVINELMYNPPEGGDEYIEILNISGASVPLNDWRFIRGVTYTFPNATLGAGEYALVVGIDPTAFRTKYSIGSDIQIFGPYSGLLDNGGELVMLARPSTPEGGTVGYIVADVVDYHDEDPWPVAADGGGASLSRRSPAAFGSEPTNWAAEFGGSPGTPNADAMLPTAQIIAVSPDPHPGPIDTITIVFSEPVTGFDLADLRLTRGGGTNLLDAGQELTTSDNITWVLSGLSRLTWVQGFYTLALTAASSGIVDLTGNPMAENATRTFVVSQSRIVGTGGDDVFHVRVSGSELHVFTSATPEGEPAYRGPLAALTNLVIDTGDGNDLIVLASPVAMTILGGAGHDRLEILGLAGNDMFTLSAAALLWSTAAIGHASIEEVHVSGGDGDDVLTLTGSIPFAVSFNGGAGTDTLAIEDGTHLFAENLEAGVERLRVSGDDAIVTFSASQHLASLTATDGAKVVLSPGGTLVLRVGELALSGEATLDIADNHLIVEGVGGESAIIGLLLGDGIISSAGPQDGKGLAMIVNDDGHGGVIREQFGGEAVGRGAILVMHTWHGDADLSGHLDGDDYFRIDAGFLAAFSGYQNGDFNYDGKIDAVDYFLIDLAFLLQQAQATLVGGMTSASAYPAPPIAPAPPAEKDEEPDATEGEVWN